MTGVLRLFDFKQKVNYKTELLAGLTVAMKKADAVIVQDDPEYRVMG